MADMIGGVDSAELAASVAADIAEGMGEGTPAVEAPVAPAEPTVEEMVAGVEVPVEELAVEGPVVPVVPEVPVAPQEATLDDVALALQRAGIDLGVSRTDLPVELHQAYDNLTNQALLAADAYTNQMTALQDSQLQMQQFATAIQEDPQKVLLTMAVTNPEAFGNAVAQYEEMQTDERVKGMIMRELKAEATLKAAQRAQEVQAQNQRNNQTSIFVNATKAAAARHGVDPSIAEEMVALSITANGGNLDVRQVDAIVGRLRPTAAAPVPVATVAKVAATAAAPTAPVQGAGTPAASVPQADESSPGLTSARSNPMIAMVKDAARRVDAAVRGE